MGQKNNSKIFENQFINISKFPMLRIFWVAQDSISQISRLNLSKTLQRLFKDSLKTSSQSHPTNEHGWSAFLVLVASMELSLVLVVPMELFLIWSSYCRGYRTTCCCSTSCPAPSWNNRSALKQIWNQAGGFLLARGLGRTVAIQNLISYRFLGLDRALQGIILSWQITLQSEVQKYALAGSAKYAPAGSAKYALAGSAKVCTGKKCKGMHGHSVQRYALAKSAKICTGTQCKGKHWQKVSQTFTSFLLTEKMAKCLET